MVHRAASKTLDPRMAITRPPSAPIWPERESHDEKNVTRAFVYFARKVSMLITVSVKRIFVNIVGK